MIDKSLRSRYQWGGPGGKSPGTSSSGGSRGGGGPPGGGDRGMTYSAPPPTADRHPDPVPINVVTTAKAPPSILSRPTPKDTRGDTPERIAEQIILDEIRKKEKEQFDADWDFENRKIDQLPLHVRPRYKEVTKGVPFLEDPITQEQRHYYGPIGSQIQPTGFGSKGDKTWHEAAEAGIKRGMGLGTLAKGVGAALAWPLASAFVPPKLMTGLTWAKRAKDIKEGKGIYGYVGKKLGLDKKLSLASTQHLKRRPKGMPENLGERGFRTRDDTPTRDGDGPKTIAEQVTQGAGLAEGQKMLGLDDKQIQQIYQGRDLLNKTIEAGIYQGQQLTAEQIKILQNKQMELNKLIEAIEKAQVPVNVAYGGRIDKALGGRSRDIG